MTTKYILDSSVWISFFYEKDKHHKWAVFLVEDLLEQGSRIIIPELIFVETIHNLRKIFPHQRIMGFEDYWRENNLIDFYLGGSDFYFDFAAQFSNHSQLKTHDFIIFAYSKFLEAELITFDKQLKMVYEKSQ